MYVTSSCVATFPVFLTIKFVQVVIHAEGKMHSLTLKDVNLTEAGEVKLTAKDFTASARLVVNGESQF